MGAWTDTIEENIKNELRRPAAAKKAGSDKTSLWLFGFVILLVAGLWMAWQSKNASPYFVQQQPYSNYSDGYSNYSYTPSHNTSPYAYDYSYQQPYQPPQMGVEQRMDRLETAARKIWDRTKWNSDRLVLLTTVNNHNTVVIRNGLPRHELIYFNSDWTINRMPDRIHLDRNDKEFLKQFITSSR